jgi:hypothetical protein
MDSTWAEHVLVEGRVFRSAGDSDMRNAFADHDLLFSLGLRHALNVPVLRDGRVVWTLNLLRAAHPYSQSDEAIVRGVLESDR